MKRTSRASLEIGEGVLCQSVQEELVLLNMANQQYYALDTVGARIWQLLLEYPDIDKVVEHIRSDYDVDEGTARGDVDALLRQLQSAGLLKTSAEPLP